MCDETTFANDASGAGGITRREFGALSASVGATLLLPRVANALDVTSAQVDVRTPDGADDCYFVHPASGAHPAVLVWPDARGLRNVYREMATRLAEAGHAVLVHNPYYRGQRAPVLPEGADARDPATMSVLRPLLAQLNPTTDVTDATALMQFLDAQPAVDTRRKAGAIGYCLGGPNTFRTAAAFPERIGAVASFHGIRLVTDEEISPHRLVAKTRAQYLVVIAEDDDAREPETKNALRSAFADAGLRAEVEVYAGAQHSFCTADSPVHHPEQAQRAWSRMAALFETALA
jgi:carboxymethylenebutenolidase